MRYTDSTEYREELQALILKNLECGTNVVKTFIPILVPIILLASICVMIKQFVLYLSTRSSSSPSSESMELSTVSAVVDPGQPTEDESQPQNDDVEQPYSVGVTAGGITILAIILNRLTILLTMYQRTNHLKFVLMELITSILIPLLWSVTNTQILRSSFTASQT